MNRRSTDIRYVLFEDEYMTNLFIKRTVHELRPNYRLVAESGSIFDIPGIIATYHPDFIISGIKLSNGLSIQEFRHSSCHIPIIFFTAYSQYLPSVFDLNVTYCALKPVSATDIEKAIIKLESMSSFSSMLMTNSPLEKANSVIEN